MQFMAFSEWIVAREQAVGATPMTPTANKPKGPSVDSEIKQAIVATMGKPKATQTSALAALAKKKQADPKASPKDLQAIADVISAGDQAKK